jgi:hypothetical protein
MPVYPGAFGGSGPPGMRYGTMALTGAEVPTEFVRVTDTDAIVFTFPPIANGTVSENCEPSGSELAL